MGRRSGGFRSITLINHIDLLMVFTDSDLLKLSNHRRYSASLEPSSEVRLMIVVCGEALMDVFAEGDTPTGVTLDARIGGSPLNVAIGGRAQISREARVGPEKLYGVFARRGRL